MSEPVTLYGANGKAQTVHAPSEVRRLQDMGWRTSPPTPTPMPTSATTAVSATAEGGIRNIEQWGNLNNKLVSTLIQAGYTTAHDVQQATDEDILSVKGIGEKALALIRQELG